METGRVPDRPAAPEATLTEPAIDAFVSEARALSGRAPLALVAAEDGMEVESTIAHDRAAGFGLVLLLTPEGVAPPAPCAGVHHARWDPHAPEALPRLLNRLIRALPEGTWLSWGYNGEYLFHPFWENRSIRALLAFLTEERRATLPACIVDLYPSDLSQVPEGVTRDGAMFDAGGYYALDRPDPARPGASLERQIDIFGGLRRRFEEHLDDPPGRIDRVPLFRTRKDLHLGPDHRFDIAEYNTVSCPWHRSPTAAVMSFRAAKGLRHNPASRAAIRDFRWPHSRVFDWSSRQLLDLGLIESGQWF